MYITSIQIKNLRCFEQAELELQYAGRVQSATPRLPNINLLLGNNGGGKSTVLKAIALAALSPVIAQSGLLPYRLVRRAKKNQQMSATVTASALLHAQDLAQDLGAKKKAKAQTQEMSISIFRNGDREVLTSPYLNEATKLADFLQSSPWDKMHDDNSPAFLVVGYGAARRIEDSEKFDESARRKSRLLSYERVAGLFEVHVTLIPLAAWLPRFKTENPRQHKQVINLLNRLLPDGASFDGKFENGEYLFEVNGVTVPFGALPDGYRAYIGWVTDLLYHISRGAPSGAKLTDACGVVMVDEIDLHLHPEWQRSVISTIANALPNLQFIFTTHSPIIAASLDRENIFVMEQTGDQASVVKQYDERIFGLNADQALLSPYFNLRTTRAAPFVSELKDLSVKAGKGDVTAALAFMEKLAGQENRSSASPERSNADAIKSAKSRLARSGQAANPKPAPAKPVQRTAQAKAKKRK